MQQSNFLYAPHRTPNRREMPIFQALRFHFSGTGDTEMRFPFTRSCGVSRTGNFPNSQCPNCFWRPVSYPLAQSSRDMPAAGNPSHNWVPIFQALRFHVSGTGDREMPFHASGYFAIALRARATLLELAIPRGAPMFQASLTRWQSISTWNVCSREPSS